MRVPVSTESLGRLKRHVEPPGGGVLSSSDWPASFGDADGPRPCWHRGGWGMEP